jgi:hypothetical protein
MEPSFQRRPNTQDISWFLDLDRNQQLDLNPPYQRRSVWTRKDRLFFLDTIFRGFPSPAIFLHKTMADDGTTTFHVVDGKQRLETILAFVKDTLRIARTFGDARLDGKKWSQLEGEPSLRQLFWNYQVNVELVNVIESSIINEVFDRLNRNSRKLTRQELRHARFDGWLMSRVEEEAKKDEWKDFGIVTVAREKRMADSQAISELVFVLLEGRIHGFDQDGLDELYAKYDDLSPETDEPESLGQFQSAEEFSTALQAVKDFLIAMDRHNQAVSLHAKTIGNFYTLWSIVALKRADLASADATADLYAAFMEKVDRVRAADDLESLLTASAGEDLTSAVTYWNNLRGASTDLTQREARVNTLLQVLSRNR